MPKKETEFEKLARLVAEGFRETATKADLDAIRAEMVTKTDLKDALEETEGRITKRFEDLVKKELTTYVDTVDLVARVKKLEEHAGL